MSDAVVFLGPTLSAEHARAELAGCEVRPPARAGDVLRALQRGARRIGIVDGYFDRVPSVWHKEILLALERGVLVYGAASMGALRAAELHTFGMVGVGQVFAMYRDGELSDDDEVTIIHGPADSGYRPLSEAMVDIRDRLAQAVDAGVVAGPVAVRLADTVKALPYCARTYARLLALAADAKILEPGAADRVRAFLGAPHASLKERDAVAMLRRMATGADRPAEARPRVERTVFLERLRLAVAREAHEGGADGCASSARDDDEDALLGLLAERHAELLALPPSEADLELAALEMSEREPAPGEVAQHDARVRERAAIHCLRRLYGAEIDRRVRRRLGRDPD